MGCPNLSVNDYFHFIEEEETDDNGFFFIGEDDYPSGSDGAKQTSCEGLFPCEGENPLCGNFCKVSIDPDGNLLSDGRFQYSWDAENRMVSSTPIVPSVNSNKVEFKYDYMGRRVEKKVYSWTGTDWQLSKTEKFVFDGYNAIASFDASNNLQKSCLWGEDLSGTLQGSGGVGGLLAVSDASGTYFPAYNGNGDIMAYVNSAGAKVAELEYSPDSRIIVKSGSKADELAEVASFSTKPYDKNLDAFIYPFRILKEGRWLSRDPIEEDGGLNLYGTGNDLVNKWDYLGLALYAIGGTDERAGDNANPRRFFLACAERPRLYWDGPGTSSAFSSVNKYKQMTGGEVGEFARKIKEEICKHYCLNKKNKKDFSINIVGWSRGAVIAADVAYLLNEEGCCCEKDNAKADKPVPVNFLGLFDAVSMSTTDTEKTAITPNVKHFAHVISTNRDKIFPLRDYRPENSSTTFKRFEMPNTTHGDIGGNPEDPDRKKRIPDDTLRRFPLIWMINQAKEAGVNMNGASF